MRINRMRVFAALMLVPLMLVSACSSNVLGLDTLVLNGKKVAVDYVMKIDGYEVEADEYRYFFMNMELQKTLGDEAYEWTQEEADELKQQTLEFIAAMRAVVFFAQEHGITLSEADLTDITGDINAAVASAGGESKFAKAIAENYMTSRVYRIMAELETLQLMLNEQVLNNGGILAFTDEQMREIINNEYVCVRYLMLEKDEDTGTAKRELANELLRRIGNGESFAELVNQYGQDSTMLNNPDGTYFTHGMTDAAVEEASFNLGINEISGVVEGTNGYYIIKRQPVDAEYINERLDTLRYYYQQTLFSNELEEIIDGFHFEFADIYAQISVFNMG